MIKVGIDTLAIYTPCYALDLSILAQARGVDPNKYQIGLGQTTMSLPPPGEDIVTMAANAAKQAIQTISLDSIEMLLFATESSIDQSKAAGIYVHDLLGLSPHCRVVELKQACYSATAALQLVLPYLRERPDKKVLLIASDIARYGLGTPGESSQGAGAVAMILAAHPRLLAIDTAYGIITENVMDFWRPNYLHEALVEGKYSSKLYLAMLEKTWEQYQTVSGYRFSDHDYHCYHTPVPRLVEKAHQHLLKLNGHDCAPEAWQQQINYSLAYGRNIGNSYSASLYIALASLLDLVPENVAHKRIGFYSYGSGCAAEYFSGIVQPAYLQMLNKNYHANLFTRRHFLSYPEYESFYQFRYVEDGSDQLLPLYKLGDYRLARLAQHKRFYETLSQTAEEAHEWEQCVNLR